MKYLIINADGYGFTAGINRAIEQTIKFGTVLSISANVNFSHADSLAILKNKYPQLSIGCHLNPIVGKSVLHPSKIPSLLDENGYFYYKQFWKKILKREINLNELRSELIAQIRKLRDLVGDSFTHIDFHMGLHRLPSVYNIFLDVVEESKINKIRTHRYLMGLEYKYPKIRHYAYLFESPTRIPKYLYNLWLRHKALNKNFLMPDRWVGISNMGKRTGLDQSPIILKNYLMMLKNLPNGFNEFVAHPGYVDEELKRWSTYLDQRELELDLLLKPEFKDALSNNNVHLIGYRDIH